MYKQSNIDKPLTALKVSPCTRMQSNMNVNARMTLLPIYSMSFSGSPVKAISSKRNLRTLSITQGLPADLKFPIFSSDDHSQKRSFTEAEHKNNGDQGKNTQGKYVNPGKRVST
jgi:hypothetical protein